MQFKQKMTAILNNRFVTEFYFVSMDTHREHSIDLEQFEDLFLLCL